MKIDYSYILLEGDRLITGFISSPKPSTKDKQQALDLLAYIFNKPGAKFTYESQV